MNITTSRVAAAGLLSVLLLPLAVRAQDRGAEVYQQTCVVCHGADGTGAMPGTPDFTAANGVLSQSDAVLFDHVANGFQAPDSPMAMPPKGGNPNLTDDDVRAVIAYMHRQFGAH